MTPKPRTVDWRAVRAACARYNLDHMLQFLRSPRLDTDHYDEQEGMYSEWIAELGRAGLQAPGLMVACLLWFIGIASAFWFPRRWLWTASILTITWMTRAFFVSSDEGSRAEDDPTLEVPLPE